MIHIPQKLRTQIITEFSDKLSSSAKLSAHLRKIQKSQLGKQIELVFKQYKDFFLKISYLVIWVVNNEHPTYCRTCGKLLNYQKRHNAYCSVKCAGNAQEVKQSIKKTNIERYGVSYFSKTKQWKQKVQSTNLEKYGVKNPNQSQQIKQKIRKTNLQRYGVENVYQSFKIKQKIKETCLQKYGVENPMQNQSIKEKSINNKSGIIIRKTLKTNQQKKEIFRKIAATNLQRYKQIVPIQLTQSRYRIAWETIQTWKQYIIPLFSFQEYNGYKHKYLWKCQLCGNIFKIHIHGTGHIKEKGYQYMPRCLNCFPINCGYSQLQKNLVALCKQYFPNLQENNRQLINPYELDIVIPQIKLAIEFNGLYWHSINGQYKLGYHLMKTQMCQKQGYRLIHIWEDQWINDQELIKQKLINVFQNSEQIQYNKWLDRSWYSILNHNNIQLKKPQLISRNKYLVENCGYFKINS